MTSSMMMYAWLKTTTEQARSTFQNGNTKLAPCAYCACSIVTHTKSIPKGDNSYKETNT